jgi:hypothetical protein
MKELKFTATNFTIQGIRKKQRVKKNRGNTYLT